MRTVGEADDDWAGRLAGGVDAAFEAFLLAHQDAVFTLALRLAAGSRADAEDVAQETFVRAYRALVAYDSERIRTMALRPWLARIALNVQRNRVRRRRPQVGVPPHDRPAPADDTPSAVAERRAGERDMAGLLACLADDARTAVVLRHVVGLPYAEVAEALGKPVGTVKAQVHRGLQRLRTIIENQENQEDQP